MEYPKILLGLIGVSVLLLVVSFLGKRAKCFRYDSDLFYKLGTGNAGICRDCGNQRGYSPDSWYLRFSGDSCIVRTGSLSNALTGKNPVKSRTCANVAGNFTSVIVKM